MGKRFTKKGRNKPAANPKPAPPKAVNAPAPQQLKTSQAHPRQALKLDLVMVAWNANGVSGKNPELVEFVARHKPDVLLLGETHLNPGSRIRLPNYVCHRDDRAGRAGVGTAIAVKASISHHWVSLPQRQHLECTAVELHRALGRLLVVSVYKPPQRELLAANLDAVHTGG